MSMKLTVCVCLSVCLSFSLLPHSPERPLPCRRYILIRRRLGEATQGDSSAKNNIIKRLTMYIIVFMFIRVWSVINRFQNLANPNAPVYALYVLHSIFSPLQGLCNALVYGVNKTLLSEYRKRFQQCCCAGRRSERLDSDVPHTKTSVGGGDGTGGQDTINPVQ